MQFIKTTIIGGLFFMLPVVVVVVVVGKALKIMLLVGKPLGTLIPTESIGGIATANVVALLAVALCCFIAGVIAKSALAKKAYLSLDTALLAIPGYAIIKGFTESMNNSEEVAQGFLPVLVRFDDSAQIGFEVERSEAGNVAVYLPGAPSPWSGSVAYFKEDRVKRLDISVAQAIGIFRKLGRGSVQSIAS
ncbi:MAG: DUF502 domain-containing protein [Desulfobacteraceae bacterium]|nr:DUF502 domain-containing protein [Desulfobacteraceae bacterium]MBC2756841.1 DUF502 domain-containing protein [Desulfobacteraceae bacterium]